MEMSVVYIEARPKGKAEGSPIDDYVVEDHADHVLGTFKTQKEAIDWAKSNGQAACGEGAPFERQEKPRLLASSLIVSGWKARRRLSCATSTPRQKVMKRSAASRG